MPAMAIALKKYKNSVIPAQAGTHSSMAFNAADGWVPACAGMTLFLYFALATSYQKN